MNATKYESIDFGFSDVKIIHAEKKDNDGNIEIKNAGKRPVMDGEQDFDPEKLSTAH